MRNSEEFDQLLKQALSTTVEPNEYLNNKIINQLKEKDNMKLGYKKRVSIALIAIIITLAMSITAYAAWRLLSPKEVAEELGNKSLATSFVSKNAIEINKTITTDGYNFTLQSIVSGKDLSDFKSSGQEINPERTYAVVAIAKEDGSKMPEVSDPDFGKVPFLISPLIKGLNPWKFNIITMNGGYSEIVKDGVLYRLIECDGIEMFADRGIYLCILNSVFYDTNAFTFNEQTGEISVNADYEGINVLFDLPVDKAKADHEKAEKYIQEIMAQ